MDEQTLTALQGSIAKWERVVKGGGEHGWQDCPLCDLFYFRDGEECEGCPVAERAGKPACSGTPYTAWVKYAWKPDTAMGRVFDERSTQLAQAELDFLKSLLPSDGDLARRGAKMTFDEWWGKFGKEGLENRTGVEMCRVIAHMAWVASIRADARPTTGEPFKDLAERLFAAAKHSRQFGRANNSPLLDEAAIEICRLRRDLEAAQGRRPDGSLIPPAQPFTQSDQ